MQSCAIANSGAPGAEYYENNSNMSSSSSNDYYNYRNYGQPGKNDQDKYWNDSRGSKSRNMNNQKIGNFYLNL